MDIPKYAGVLILTSSGMKASVVGDELVKRLPKLACETKLAHVTTAAKVYSDKDFVARDIAAMHKYGFNITEVDLEGADEEGLYEQLKEFDIVYVQGGNGFYLLKYVRASGFERIVRKLLVQGKWYVGVSAGTYVCCPTIEMHTWKRQDDNRYGLTDLTAMGLVPFLVTVHYNRDKYREVLAKHIPTATYPVRILTDEQALWIEGGQVELVGTGPEILAEEIV